MSRFDGKSVVITGGASGIGEATVRLLHEQGASVVAADLRQEDLDRLGAEFSGSDRFVGIPANVADREDVADLLNRAVKHFGTPHGLVNCAGIRCVGSVLDVDPDDWQRVLDVNLTGTFNASQAFARVVTAAKGNGAIVNMSSSAGIRGVPNRVGYAASKFGVTGITQTMALELASMGIRVNAIAPGMIKTPFTVSMFADPENAKAIANANPAGRAGEPEEIASTIAFLLSDDASFITGVILPVDGGQTVGIRSF